MSGRRLVEDPELYAQRQNIPAIYVVDAADLRVLWCRPDPAERRQDYRGGGHDLPPAIAHAARRLIVERQAEDPRPDSMAVMATPSLLVRVVWLQGTPEACAILVERFRLRDYMSSARTRFKLSDRELEVLSLIMDGLTNDQIGDHLNITRSTAVYHIKQLFEKMQVKSRMELVSRFLS